MGIPKFYRWISERYPCLSEVLKEYQIPEFDNLYLDMNGIIHTCSHPDDKSIFIQTTEDKIFNDICHYVEVLFRMIKPKKVFYMAVDGVAPRAKMNQQRSRRFRSAKEAEDLIKKSIAKGEKPVGTRFDSNCITPGTEFMTRLHTALKEFVAKKVNSDPLWQRPDIIFSGHETPGEGEHKIMDFIRYEKSRPGFDPNTRHCLYGLDADLIMLSLITHEPHFALLREEIKFIKKDAQKRTVLPEDTTFHLLHISLLRDYLDLEFGSLKESLSFEYDLERIIDDWVLMGFLVGNDFVPHLPNFHIHHDCLPVLWSAYKEARPELDGYLNEGGTLNLSRFEKYLSTLHQFDFDKFHDKFSDDKWLKGKKKGGGFKPKKKGRQKNNNKSIHISSSSDEESGDEDEELNGVVGGLIPKSHSLSSDIVGIPSASEFIQKSSTSLTDLTNTSELTIDLGHPLIQCDERMCEEFKNFKNAYYVEKFKFNEINEKIIQTLANGYVIALQWILHYYYNGIQSWSWFYPRHYAPFLSDLKNLSNLDLKFDMACPFLPFQQLMAVLPKASKQLLPAAYQELMDEGSSLEEYYPETFESDLNGKLQEWEAVVLIPFIDEEILLKAMEPLTRNLTQEESKTNKHGPHHMFCYNETNMELYHSRTIKRNNKSLQCELKPKHFVLPIVRVYKGLCKNVNLKALFYGFPTLRHVLHTGSLKSCGVKVFQRNSSNLSMVLSLETADDAAIKDVGRSLIGQIALVNWPHLIEALVVYMSTDEEKIKPSRNISDVTDSVELYQGVLNPEEQAMWHKEMDLLKERYMFRYGIDIGETCLLIGGRRLIGKKHIIKSSGEVVLVKQWSSIIETFLYQTSVKSEERRSGVEESVNLVTFFDVGSTVFLLSNPHYGSEGKVLEVSTTDKPRITAKFTIPTEPIFEHLKAKANELEDSFVPAYIISQRLAISAHLLSRVTGTVFLFDEESSKKINIGLNLKYNKQNMEVPGFTKKTAKEWLYSREVFTIMDKYLEKFPELFEGIAMMMNKDVFSAFDIFGEDRSDKVASLETFLKSLPSFGLEPRPHGTVVLGESVVQDIEREVTKAKNSKHFTNMMKVKPHLLFISKIIHSPCAPDESASYELLDRVVNIRSGFSVPLGLRGTVIGKSPGEKGQDMLYDVLFDKEFPGAMSLRSSSSQCYRVPPIALINISYGTRKNSYTTNTRQATSYKKPALGTTSNPSNKSNHNVSAQQYQPKQILSRTKQPLLLDNSSLSVSQDHNTVNDQDKVSNARANVRDQNANATGEHHKPQDPPQSDEYSRLWNQLKNTNAQNKNDNLPLNVQTKQGSLPLNVQTKQDNLPLNVQTKQDNLPLNAQTKQGNLPLNVQTKQGNLPLNVQTKQDNLSLNAQTKQGSLPLNAQTKQGNLPLNVQTKQDNLSLSAQTKQGSLPLNTQTKQGSLPLNVQTKQGNLPLNAQTKQGSLPLNVQTKQGSLPSNAQTKQGYLNMTSPNKQGNFSMTTPNKHGNSSTDMNGNPNNPLSMPTPPNLKPPQSWLEQSSSSKKSLQGSQQFDMQNAKRISFEELMRSTEPYMQQLSLNNNPPHPRNIQGFHANNFTQTPAICQASNWQQNHHQPHQQQHNYNQYQPQQQQQNHHLHKQQDLHHHQQQFNFSPNYNGRKKEELMEYCNRNHLGLPKFEVRYADGGQQARVHLKNGGWFVGSTAGNWESAIESAATLALHRLVSYPQPQLQQFEAVHKNSNLTTAHPPPSSSSTSLSNQPPLGSSSLRPKANSFVPTQVLLRQTLNKGTPECTDGLKTTENPLRNSKCKTVATTSNNQEQIIATKTESPINKKKVTVNESHHRRHKKRIAANFTSQQ